ncbi:Mediator of RNA polymerase II transcription subunit 26 [Hibiscus syriacus]|uniref:Mediator of RNA polymerase II transcription subunit 26 n=1 Tax=Hibiscus syriacus TaxID=106335 RepID=A0A6A2YM01_HIBSY|nr:Mediator of RNA polymerase II transcription subunit 26 [Hibiscus syriacus]
MKSLSSKHGLGIRRIGPRLGFVMVCHKREWVEKLLEDFLRFVDVYGIFQSSLLALKEEQLAARMAMRRKDDSKIAVYLKSRKKMAKEIAKLVSSIRSVWPGYFQRDFDVVLLRKSSWMGLTLKKNATKVRVEESIKEFQQIGEADMWGLVEKEDDELRMVLNRMQELERCLSDVENGSEKAFRSLIKTRVSLLNTLTK